jgi:S-adenosylmethionine synthetase
MKKAVEAQTAGQPDKVCDQIVDAIVDEYLKRDPTARIDLKALGSHGMLMIGGEVTSNADFDLSALAKAVYRDIGYADDIEVFVNIDKQSPQMRSMTHGSADTVIAHGYATAETRERLPVAVVFAQTIARRLDDLRRADPAFSWLQPDGKAQLVLEKDRVVAVTILASHAPSIQPRDVQTAILERVVSPIVGQDGVRILINPIGPFTQCGFAADSGVSGQCTASDTYGGLIPSGDLSLCGRDPLRAERAGTYMARMAARYIVDQGLAASAMVSAVYSLGISEPVHIHAVGLGEKSRGTKMDLTNLIKQQFDFRPEAIVERLQLRRPLYRAVSLYGQFGRPELPWEESAAA